MPWIGATALRYWRSWGRPTNDTLDPQLLGYGNKHLLGKGELQPAFQGQLQSDSVKKSSIHGNQDLDYL
jgi:hypothetical protein